MPVYFADRNVCTTKEISSQYTETSEGEQAFLPVNLSYQHIVVDRGGVSVNTPFIYR